MPPTITVPIWVLTLLCSVLPTLVGIIVSHFRMKFTMADLDRTVRALHARVDKLDEMQHIVDKQVLRLQGPVDDIREATRKIITSQFHKGGEEK